MTILLSSLDKEISEDQQSEHQLENNEQPPITDELHVHVLEKVCVTHFLTHLQIAGGLNC